MSRKADSAFLFDIVDSGDFIAEVLKGKTFNHYVGDRVIRSVVERQIEIIGEAARKVSPAFKADHPEIEWRKIIATRNIFVHDYDRLVDDVVWRIATVHVPILVAQVRPLIPTLPPTLPFDPPSAG